MTKTIKLALAAAMAMGATSAFATNGDNLIGLGAESRAMGGTGIAHFMGAESSLNNPALLAKMKGTEISFGATYFHPSVDFTNDAGTSTSDARHNVIPEVAIAGDLGNGLAYGIGMFGSAGMGTDYRDNPTAYNMRTNLQLMKFAPSIAYGQDNWSVGAALVAMYGSLDITFLDGTSGLNSGNGSSQDFGFGYQLGAAYTLPDTGLTFGLTYVSEISMEYKDQIGAASARFPMNPLNDELTQPAEIGFGIDWTQGDLSITADYKQIQWGSAEGYKDFNWDDQDVYAIGVEYRMSDLALRAGYNYGENPIDTPTPSGAGTMNTASLNTFNLLGFPAITENHVTLGAGYQFTKQFSADVAYVYGWTSDVSATGFTADQTGLTTVTTDNDQNSLTVAIKYNF
jgi:long-chain fatty acid transport protein